MVRRLSGPRRAPTGGDGLVRRAPGYALLFMLAALAALAALPACGGGHDASEKQIDALRGEIVKLRAETSILTERLDAK